jgi:cob(I)alamin adenosyltransferase
MTTKIYTKKGDTGITNLYDTRGVSKSEPIFDALGDLDELSSHIGHLCSIIEPNPIFKVTFKNKKPVTEHKDTGLCIGFNRESDAYKDLRWIQICLLNIGSDMSTKDVSKHTTTDQHVETLELRTDVYNQKSSRLTEFILLGSSQPDSLVHICRVVSRRAERNMWKANQTRNIDIPICFQYMNRLSSFFFALARYMAGDNEVTRSMYDEI